MTSDPRTVFETDRISTALTRLGNGTIHQLPVVDQAHRLVGLLSDVEVRSAIGYDAMLGEELSVSEVMTASPETIPLGATLDDALRVLCTGGTNALPVMLADKLVGIITRRDVLQAFRKVLGLDRSGRRVEIALPNQCEDLARAFTALASVDGEITSAVVSSMRKDGDEPTLYLRVGPGRAKSVERLMRDAGLIVLVPEHS